MNAMPFTLMKFAALIAAVVFSVQPVQRSTCRCQHCPQRASVTVESSDQSCCDEMACFDGMESGNCCCSDGPVAPGKHCPCGCQQVPTDQGIEPQSELPQFDTTVGQTMAWLPSSVTNSQPSSTQSVFSTAGVSLCIALCRFRL